MNFTRKTSEENGITSTQITIIILIFIFTIVLLIGAIRAAVVVKEKTAKHEVLRILESSNYNKYIDSNLNVIEIKKQI